MRWIRTGSILLLTVWAGFTGLVWILSYVPPGEPRAIFRTDRAYVQSWESCWFASVRFGRHNDTRLLFRVSRGVLETTYSYKTASSPADTYGGVVIGSFAVSRKIYPPPPDMCSTATASLNKDELRRWNMPTDNIVVSLPFWFLFGLLVLYPTVALMRGPVRLRRRHRKGLCLECGYDLTGNVTGVCPECGTAVPQAHRE